MVWGVRHILRSMNSFNNLRIVGCGLIVHHDNRDGHGGAWLICPNLRYRPENFLYRPHSDKSVGGIYYWTYKYSSPRYRNILCWIVGYINTITYISGVAGVAFASASAIMAAATIGSDGRFIPTIYQT